MSLFSDNYGLIQPLHRYTDKSYNVIIEKIVNGTFTSDEIEVLQNLIFFNNNNDNDLTKIMTNYIRSYKRNLQHQRNKNKEKDIELDSLFQFINTCIERVQTLSLILGNSINTNQNKFYGNSLEIKLIIELFWKNLLQETWLNNLIFYKIVNNEYGSMKYIKLIEKLNNYSNSISYYNWFLNNLGLYLLKNQKNDFDFINEKFLPYYKLLALSDSMKKYVKISKSINSDVFLIPIKKQMVFSLKEILDKNDKDIPHFILTNKDLIFEIYNYSKHFIDTIRNEIIVKIIHYIFNEEIVSNVELFDKVINFISDLMHICEHSEKKFINKLFSDIILKNEELTINIIETMIYNNLKQFSEETCKYLMTLIGSNDLSLKFFEINFKAILTNYILEKYIEDNNKYDYISKNSFENSEIYKFFNKLENLFKSNKSGKLKHDIFKMKLDYQNSKTFFDSYRKSFPESNFINGVVLNPFVWNCNTDQGYIDNMENEGILSENINNLFSCFGRISGKTNISKSKRKLLIHPHLGEIKFNMTINKITKEFTVLPIHHLIIEQIITEKITTVLELQNNYIFKKYSDKFKNDVIKSFYKSKFLLEDSVTINPNINQIEDNILSIVFIGTMESREKLNKKFVFSKNTILSSWINKLLKTGNKNYNEIKTYLIKNLEIGFFRIDDDILDNTISDLIKNDYIKIDDDSLYQKILY